MQAPVLWILSLFLMTAAQNQAPPTAQANGEKAAASGSAAITAESLKDLVSEGKALVVDVRDEAEFGKETVPGAVNIPLDQLQEKLKEMSPDTLLVFICNTGRRSARAQKQAEEAGFKTASYCSLKLWREQGFKTEPGKRKIP